MGRTELPTKHTIVRKCTVVALLVLLFVFLTYALQHASERYVKNADGASIVLEGVALLSGNWNLHGWTTPSDSFWLIDIPFYALVALFRGVTPNLMRDVPVLLYSLSVAAALWLSTLGSSGRTSLLAAAAAFLLVGLPSSQTATPLLGFIVLGPMHIGTILYGITSLGFLHMALGTSPQDGVARGRRGLLLLVSGLIMASAIASDPFTTWIFVLPIVVSAAVPIWLHRNRAQHMLILGWTTAAFAAGRLALALCRHLGGFQTVPETAQFTALSDLPTNVLLALQGLMGLFGADFFALPVFSVHTALILAHLIGLTFTLWAVAVAIAAWWHGRESDWLSTVLAIGFVMTIVEYSVSTNATNLATTRYLLPAVFFGGIVASRGFSKVSKEIKDGMRVVVPVCGVFALASIASFGLVFTRPPATYPIADVGTWLISHDLRRGFGSYWDASIVTLETRGRVAVRPIVGAGDRFVRFPLHNNAEWYAIDKGVGIADFLIWGGPDAYFPDHGVDLDTAIRALGQPTDMYTVGGYHIALWDHDLAGSIRTE